jgi:hypothetical protein
MSIVAALSLTLVHANGLRLAPTYQWVARNASASCTPPDPHTDRPRMWRCGDAGCEHRKFAFSGKCGMATLMSGPSIRKQINYANASGTSYCFQNSYFRAIFGPKIAKADISHTKPRTCSKTLSTLVYGSAANEWHLQATKWSGLTRMAPSSSTPRTSTQSRYASI